MFLFSASPLHHHVTHPGRQSTHYMMLRCSNLAKGQDICNASIITFTQTVSVIIKTSLNCNAPPYVLIKPVQLQSQSRPPEVHQTDVQRGDIKEQTAVIYGLTSERTGEIK